MGAERMEASSTIGIYMKRAFVYTLIFMAVFIGCTERNVSENKQPAVKCNFSDLSIFPHPNDAGVTLAVLAMDKQTKKNRIIRIDGEVCEGYKLYRILPSGVELKNNDDQTKQIAYAKSAIIAKPAIKLEQTNREAVKKAEQLQKYGIPQTMGHIHAYGNSENALVNVFTGTRFTGR